MLNAAAVNSTMRVNVKNYIFKKIIKLSCL